MKDKKREEDRDNIPLYPISIASELLGTTDQTLRLYEKHGLITPARRKKNRFYSENDIRWLRCLRDLIHKKKISIEGIKKLLQYAPCWEILDCELKEKCPAYRGRKKRCWELNKMVCQYMDNKTCEQCIVYLSHKREEEKKDKSESDESS
ncbi:MAG: MerR family transcriptional regulator [Nitrospirae bacterium]|nr:MAG: MerR family transcriptional regulator [Nitrospirota bacterium]